MNPLLIVISFLFLIDSNLLHQNTPLRIAKNGNIIGLPKEFSPAKFDLDKKYLRINNKEIIIPDCLNNFFNENENTKLKLSASWYHSKDIMPHYLNFDISQKKLNFGYSILVNLENLELIYVRKSIKIGNMVDNPEVELGEECLDEYKNRIKILE